LAQSTVSISPSSIQSGNAATVTLTARDAAGNQETGGGLTIAFGLGAGSSSGTFSGVTDNGDGTYTATFTGATAGTGTTITATIGGNAVTSALPAITVTPGAVSLAQSTVSISPSSIQSGDTASVTLTAVDAAGNLETGGLSVVFGLGAGNSSGTFSAVSYLGNGAYTATFTGTTAGTATTITAGIGGSAITSALPTIKVTPGAVSLARSLVSISPSSIQSGNTATVTLTARDANGNQESGGGLTITFGLGAGSSSGTFSSVTDNGNGTYTATFTGALAGTATTITAGIGGNAVTSALPTITVTPAAVSLSKSTVSINPSSIQSGNTATVTVTARDANGNLETGGGLSVAFGLGAGTSSGTFSAVSYIGNGAYTATFTGGIVGSNTIAATIGGQSVVSSPAFTITPIILSPADVGVPYHQVTTLTSGATRYTALTVATYNAGGTALAAPTPNAAAGTLTFNSTPLGVGTVTFAVNAINANGGASTLSYSITVYPALAITPSILPAATFESVYNGTISVNNPLTTLTVTNFSAGATGLSVPTANLAAGTVAVSGVPTGAGSASFQVTAVDAAGVTAIKNYTLTVNKAAVQTVVSPLTSSVYGNAATFTALVSGGIAGNPTTGTVTFAINGVPQTPSVPLSGTNVATLSTTATGLAVGSYKITATYNGNANFAASPESPGLTQTVTGAATSVAINPSEPSGTVSYGAAMNFAAVVSITSGGAPGSPVGTVTFYDGSVGGTLLKVNVPLVVVNATTAQAVFTTTATQLSATTHNIYAVFTPTAGNTKYLTSTGLLSYAINPAVITTTLASAPALWALNNVVVFTATIADTTGTAGVPAGTVTFVVDGAKQTPIAVFGGKATFATTFTTTGAHSVSAFFTPAPAAAQDFQSSPAITQVQTVRKQTSMKITSVASFTTVTINAAVSTTATGGPPTGTVNFYENGALLGTANVNASGVATITLALPPGTNNITAVYSGDGNFNPVTLAKAIIVTTGTLY
jgi:adhesin/invasin